MSALNLYTKTKFNPKRPTGFILAIKNNKDGMLDELFEITSFLNRFYQEPTIKQRLYHFLNSKGLQSCPYCNKPCKPYTHNQRLIGHDYYMKTCGDVECNKKYNQEQTQIVIKEKYGVDNISQTKEWREKVKKTNIRKRGVEWNTQAPEFINARKESWKENKDEILEKRYITTQERYGVKHVLQSEDIKKKIKLTNLLVYGESHPSKSILGKRKRFKYKDYTLPSGKIIKIQGYEDKALNELLKYFNEDDLIVSDIDIENEIGKIFYKDINGNEHRYFPDIYIKSLNKLIEVKSMYTMSVAIDTNFRKRDACINNRFDFEFMIFK
jgi:hypothetical protein